MKISVVLCIRDRADDLGATLRSLDDVAVPDGCDCALIVIGNASTDHTPQVIDAVHIGNMGVRHLYEPKAGVSRARNLGLSEAQGDIIVFTDDDLRYPQNWLGVMAEPLLSGNLDTVTGAMRLAPHLERPWSANMALRRHVLDRVPGFDPELGPGARGFGEDTPFGHHLLKSGFILGSVSLRAEHHFLPERLTRASFLNHVKKLGLSGAHTAHLV